VAIAVGVLTGGACVALLGLVAGGVTAAVIGPLGWLAVGWVLRRPVGAGTDPSVPLVLDLAAAALRAGAPVADALARAGAAARPDTAADLARVVGLLRLGADPDPAWAVLPPRSALRPLVAVAVRSSTSGMKLATSFERLAADLRAERAAAGAARAHRAGVTAMGPLAACFLPSFVCLGVVPVIAGIARTVLSTTAHQ
jgi:Flp pilus assembly protein TadB